jgi:hypothetical protein
VGSASNMVPNAKSVQFQIATRPSSLRDTVQHTDRAIANAFMKIVIIKLFRVGSRSKRERVVVEQWYEQTAKSEEEDRW